MCEIENNNIINTNHEHSEYHVNDFNTEEISEMVLEIRESGSRLRKLISELKQSNFKKYDDTLYGFMEYIYDNPRKICKELIYDTLYNPGQFIFKTMVIYSGIKCVELIKNQLVY